MGKPRHYWYYIIYKMIRKSVRNDTPAEKFFANAVKKTFEDMERFEDADLRKKALNMVFFENKYTHQGVADRVYVSKRTLQYWVSWFVETVGYYTGFAHTRPDNDISYNSRRAFFVLISFKPLRRKKGLTSDDVCAENRLSQK